MFGYESLRELFTDVQEDLVAQLLMKEKDEASQELAKILDISYDDLLEIPQDTRFPSRQSDGDTSKGGCTPASECGTSH